MADLIELTSLCQALNCLPEPGGLRQQPWDLVLGMTWVLGAQAEKAKREQAKVKK